MKNSIYPIYILSINEKGENTMKKLATRSLALVLVLVLCIGLFSGLTVSAATEADLIGTWQTANGQRTVVFNADGTGTYTYTGAIGGGSKNLTWSYDGTTLKITPEIGSFAQVSFDGTTLKAKPQVTNYDWAYVAYSFAKVVTEAPVEEVTVHANVPASWDKANLWAWVDQGENAFDAWPGQAMTLDGDWYTTTMPANMNRIIINNGSAQTDNLVIEAGKEIWIIVAEDNSAEIYYEEPELIAPPAEPNPEFVAMMDGQYNVNMIMTGLYELTITPSAPGAATGTIELTDNNTYVLDDTYNYTIVGNQAVVTDVNGVATSIVINYNAGTMMFSCKQLPNGAALVKVEQEPEQPEQPKDDGLQLGDNDLPASYYGTSSLFVAPEAGQYVFSLVENSDNIFMITITQGVTDSWLNEGDVTLTLDKDEEIIIAGMTNEGNDTFKINIAKSEAVDPEVPVEPTKETLTLNLGDNNVTLKPNVEYTIALNGIEAYADYILTFPASVTISWYGNPIASGETMNNSPWVLLTATVTEEVSATINLAEPVVEPAPELNLGENHVEYTNTEVIMTYTATEAGTYVFAPMAGETNAYIGIEYGYSMDSMTDVPVEITLEADQTVMVYVSTYNYEADTIDFTFNKKGAEEPEEPEVPTSATITFDTTDKRTEYSTEIQVWVENGITVTNDKDASTSNVGNYSNPARFYAGSKLTIAYPGMRAITINLNSGKPASGLINSLTGVEGITVIEDGYVITIVLDEAADSFVIESLAGQIRVNSITVSTEAPEEGGEEEKPEEKPEEPTLNTIAEALAATSGDFTVEGQILFIDGKNLYIADETGAIVVRMNSNPDASWVIGGKIKVTGPRGDYNGLPQLNGCDNAAAVFTATNEQPTPISGDVSIIKAENLCQLISVTGEFTVESVNGSKVTIKDAEGNTVLLYKAKETLAVGDKVTAFVGALSTYNGLQVLPSSVTFTPGEGSGEQEKPEDPEANSELTIPEAVELGESKAHDTFTENKYYITGVVAEIKSDVWGNMYIKDEAGNQIYIYGLYNEDGSVRYDEMEKKPAVGDTIKVYGVVGQYNGSAQIKNAWLVVEESAPTGDNSGVLFMMVLMTMSLAAVVVLGKKTAR